MQVKVRVFESYAIRDGFIFPLGGYIDKTLDRKAIKKALIKFVKIKNEEDVLGFAKEYGLLNLYEINFFFEDRTQERPKGLFKSFSEGHTLISWRANLTIQGIYSPVILKYEDDIRTMTIFPSYELIVMDLLGGGYPWPEHLKQPNIPFNQIVEYYRSRKTSDFIYMLGEYLGFSNKEPTLSWAGWVRSVKQKAEALMKLTKDEEEYTKRQLVEEYLLDKKFEADVKISYTVIKKGKGAWPFEVKTELVFKSLIQAFIGLIFTKGMVKACVECGKLFIPQSDKAIYCSPACRVHHHRKNKQNRG